MNGIKVDKILDSLKSGDQNAFTIIYNHYWEKLYIAAYARLKDTTAAEEVVQEVFLQLWIKRASFEIQNLSAYLAAMTRHGVYKYLARESKMKEREEVWNSRAPSYFTPFSNLEDQLLLEFIRDLSTELPEKCRLVFIKNKLEDQSIKDIANEMNISQKTAEAHITKALRFIRIQLHNHLGIILWILSLTLFL